MLDIKKPSIQYTIYTAYTWNTTNIYKHPVLKCPPYESMYVHELLHTDRVTYTRRLVAANNRNNILYFLIKCFINNYPITVIIYYVFW